MPRFQYAGLELILSSFCLNDWVHRPPLDRVVYTLKALRAVRTLGRA